MTEIPAGLPGLRLFESRIFRDPRGYFLEHFRADHLAAHGITENFVQDNRSSSHPGVLRGLHFQSNPPQGKLVSVASGAIFDVAVDLRAGSDHFGQWFGHELSAENGRILWVPYGFAHGFCVIGEEAAVVLYKVTGFYNPASEGGLRWNDPALGIRWPLAEPQLNAKDQDLPLLKDLAPLKLP